MNREQVIELMREVGAGHDHPMPNDYAGVVDVFVKFAEFVAAVEREACAKVCEEISDDYMQSESRLYPEMKTDAQAGASDCEAAIRARNTSKETK